MGGNMATRKYLMVTFFIFVVILMFFFLKSFVEFEKNSIGYKECQKYQNLLEPISNQTEIKDWIEYLKTNDRLLKRLHEFSPKLYANQDDFVNEFKWPFPNAINVSNFEVYGVGVDPEKWDTNKIAGFKVGLNMRFGIYYVFENESLGFDIQNSGGVLKTSIEGLYVRCQ